MAKIYEPLSTEKSISFEKLIETIDPLIGDKINNETVEACVEPLQLFSNNTEEITRFLNKELGKSKDEFQDGNAYSEQSFMLYENPRFYIRLTYWPINSKNDTIRNAENKLFFYNLAHDHNFPFLTVGCKGNGYTTRLWEYDYNKVVGYKNEDITLKFQVEDTLNKGKAMYYRPSKDIHCQLPPTDEDCIAVNIIFNNFAFYNNHQFIFDTENQKIVDLIDGSSGTIYGMLNLVKLFNNKEDIDILIDALYNHPNPILRRRIAMTIFDMNDDESIWLKLLDDKDIRNQKFAELQMSRLSKHIAS